LPVLVELGISGVIGLLLGSLLAWLVLRSRTAALQARLSLIEKEVRPQRLTWEDFRPSNGS